MNRKELDYDYIFSIKKLLNIISNKSVIEKSIIVVPKLRIYNMKLNIQLINRVYSLNLLDFYEDYSTSLSPKHSIFYKRSIDKESSQFTTLIKNMDTNEYMAVTKYLKLMTIFVNIANISKEVINATKIIEVNSFNFNMMKRSFEKKFLNCINFNNEESLTTNNILNYLYNATNFYRSKKPEIIMIDHYNKFIDNLSVSYAKDVLPVSMSNTAIIYKNKPIWFRENYTNHTFEKGERFVKIDDTITIISDNKNLLSSLELEFTV